MQEFHKIIRIDPKIAITGINLIPPVVTVNVDVVAATAVKTFEPTDLLPS